MKNIFLLLLLTLHTTAYAQSTQHSDDMDMQGMKMRDTTDMGNMTSALSRSLPMNRNGSGTSWQPDAAPMYMYMLHSGKWMYMIHGNIFVRYDKQDIGHKGTRGDEGFDAPNMLMFMGQRNVGKKGIFHFNTMFSLDAVVTGERGYPLLFQTGESAHGVSLVDRQHPHDLFSELSASYAYSFNKKTDLSIYAGYPGEPALGATTFMHRASGMDNPDAPLSHHWVDATHITFGVVTLGLRYGKFKLEGSSFTGREPNEQRYDFDKPTFDSRSARLWYNPNRNWSLQVSHGFLKSPEALRPNEDIYRTTASAAYGIELSREVFFNGTALWGMNKQKAETAAHAALLEAALRAGKLVAYLRYEWVQKSTEELNLDPLRYGSNTLFPVNAFTLGAGFDVLRTNIVRAAVGTQLSVFHASQKLNDLYGSYPFGGEVYIRFYPSLMAI